MTADSAGNDSLDGGRANVSTAAAIQGSTAAAIPGTATCAASAGQLVAARSRAALAPRQVRPERVASLPPWVGPPPPASTATLRQR
jgi:hypothetical protein